MTLYDRIRKRREELEISQDELAKKLGYKSRSTIAKIESGENDITQSKIVAFAKALNVTPAYLMGWEPAPAPTTEELTPQEKSHLNKYRKLTPPHKSTIDDQIEFMLYQQELDAQKEGLCLA